MLKKLVRFIIVCICIIGLTLSIACNSKDIYEIKVTSPVKEHSKFSSATPGLPLTVYVVDENGEKVFEDFNFSFNTEYGSLVTWKEIDDRVKGNYKVTSHGNVFEIHSCKMVKLFWSRLSLDKTKIPDDINEILLDIEVYDSKSQLLNSKQVVIKIEDWTSSLVEE